MHGNLSDTRSLQNFLTRLADEARPQIAAYNVAVVLAGPEEAIGCGAVLKRLRGARLVIVTSGVGEGASFPLAMLRWHALLGALGNAGHRPGAITGLGIPQGEASQHLASIAGRLAGVFALHGTALALTHAQEDDEPDRNATAFAVQYAAALCGQRGQPVSVLKMLPHKGRGRDAATTSLVPQSGQTVTLALTAEDQALMTRMRACFAPSSTMLQAGKELPDHSKGLYVAHEGRMGDAPVGIGSTCRAVERNDFRGGHHAEYCP